MSEQTTRQAHEHPREEWPRMLSGLPSGRVISTADELRTPYRLEPLMLPARGLALLRMQEGCFGDHYHLGEIPLAEVAVELVDKQDQRFSGGARVMSSSVEYAEAVAVIDAVVEHKLPGWRRAADLLHEGRSLLNTTEAHRAEIRERTRVDFAALSSTGGEDEDV